MMSGLHKQHTIRIIYNEIIKHINPVITVKTQTITGEIPAINLTINIGDGHFVIITKIQICDNNLNFIVPNNTYTGKRKYGIIHQIPLTSPDLLENAIRTIDEMLFELLAYIETEEERKLNDFIKSLDTQRSRTDAIKNNCSNIRLKHGDKSETNIK